MRLKTIGEAINHNVKSRNNKLNSESKRGANEDKVNEDVSLSIVAAGVAAILASGVGLAGLLEYLKEHYPKAYAALSHLGSAATDSKAHGVNH